RTPVEARRALLESWLGREPLAPAELDRVARARRIEVVARRARRWLRGGNAVAELVHAGRRAVVRRDWPADARAQLFEAVARASEGVERGAKRVGLASNRPAPRAERLQLATERLTLDAANLELGERRFVVVRGRAKELESAWLAAARLDEHALAVARPALWLAGRAGAAAFELPRDARPFADAPAAVQRRALAEWLGAAWDRGLWLPEIPRHACWLDGDGRAWLVAPPTPRPTRRGELARSGLAHSGLDVSRAELARALVASNRGHDLASVERELARA
ncbi:MAG: hypothetical protein IT453_06975, partial [Planctomycetes bacterium]|nr:hypothetical protein [Planctomycetota bacterium]